MGELTEQHAGSTRLSVEAMAAAPLLFAHAGRPCPPLARCQRLEAVPDGWKLARPPPRVASDHRNLTKYIRPLPLRRYLTHRGRARKYDALRHIFERAPPRGRSRAPLAPRALRAAIALRKPCECLTRLGLGSSPGRVDPPRIQRIQGGQVLLLHGLLYPRPLFSGFLLDARLSSASCAAAGAFERAVADSPRRTPRGEGGLCVFKRVL